MPRIPRGQEAGFVYHVINRGNGRATIFHKAQDDLACACSKRSKTACPESYRRVQSLRSVHHGIDPFQSLQTFSRFAPFQMGTTPFPDVPVVEDLPEVIILSDCEDATKRLIY